MHKVDWYSWDLGCIHKYSSFIRRMERDKFLRAAEGFMDAIWPLSGSHVLVFLRNMYDKERLKRRTKWTDTRVGTRHTVS